MNVHAELDCSNCRSKVSKDDFRFTYVEYANGEKVNFPISNENRLLFILSGAFTVTSKEVDKFKCNSDQIVLLMGDCCCQLEIISPVKALILNFFSSIQVCDKIARNDVNSLLDGINYQFNVLDMRGPMMESMHSIVRYIHEGVQCMYLHRSKQTELFVLFRHYYSLLEVSTFFYKTIRNDISFRSLVMRNYMHAKNVEELAALCGYGLSNFKRIFKKNFNESPYRWMLQQLANRIYEKLLDRNVPIKAIVAQFNFSDQSHFTTYCKRFLGGTPMQVREGLKKINSNTLLM